MNNVTIKLRRNSASDFNNKFDGSQLQVNNLYFSNSPASEGRI